MPGKTLEELGVQVEDVVKSTCNNLQYTVLRIEGGRYYHSTCRDERTWLSNLPLWQILSRAPVIKYGDWQVGLQVTTPEDADTKSLGDGWVAYRLPIKPVVVEKTCYIAPNQYGVAGFSVYADSTNRSVARLTFNIVDGVPDCDSVKMTKL